MHVIIMNLTMCALEEDIINIKNHLIFTFVKYTYLYVSAQKYYYFYIESGFQTSRSLIVDKIFFLKGTSYVSLTLKQSCNIEILGNEV